MSLSRPSILHKTQFAGVFGIQQRAFQVGGTLLRYRCGSFCIIYREQRERHLDYEQRFPEDKPCEGLGPLARVWRTYLEECAGYDAGMLEGWRDGLDVLLVFAGLFSAVVTTFVGSNVAESTITATLLFELIDVQRAAANGSVVNDVPRSNLTPFSSFRPGISDSLVNGLWFTSLSFSLATALFAVLTKQWIHQYIAMTSGTPRERCHVRQFRYMGLEQWGVGFIIGLLPVLLSVSLSIFLVGLVLFLAPLQTAIASIVGTITFVTFAIYLITNLLPIWFPSCPYKTLLSQYIFLSYAYIITLVSSAFTSHEASSSQVPRQSSAQLLNLGPKTSMYMPWAGYGACPPTLVYRALLCKQPVLYPCGQSGL
ncbi:hypothetical protein F5146DRAFT_932179 [Armillaria mellea]|nr:hypothetical protein F5146DRAFT_932179 [Armillaria mellea]